MGAHDGYIPTGFCIMHAGRLIHGSRELIFDDMAAAAVMTNAKSLDRPLVGDFEFKTLQGYGSNGSHELSISSFAAVLKFDAQMKKELWAEDVRWTDRALLLLRARAYRYCVPAFVIDDDNRPVRLLGLALSNNPTDPTLKPLV